MIGNEVKYKRGDFIGHLLIYGFNDNEKGLFDKVIEVIEIYSGYKKYEHRKEQALCFPGLEIYPDRRKIFCEHREINLTVKEFDILCFLASNRGRVMTYALVYTLTSERLAHVILEKDLAIPNTTIIFHY